MISLQKITIIVFCIGMIALVGSVSNPVCAKKSTKTTAEEKTKISRDHKPAETVIDLAVERIWLDNECYVNFQLKNNGMGKLHPEDHKALHVRVHMGKKDERLTLPEVDHHGVLANPGGVIDYTTKLSVLNVARITVELAGAPGESNHQNNRKIRTLSGRCQQEMTKSKANPAKKEKRSKILTTSKSVSVSKTQNMSPPAEKHPPFISLEGLYLRDNKIYVVIRNLANDPVSVQTAMQGRLKVKTGKRYHSWSLLQLDPARAKLNRGSKELHYDTGLVLRESETVLAELLNVPGKGTKIQKKRLSPQISSMVESGSTMTTTQAKKLFAPEKNVTTYKGPMVLAKRDTEPGKKSTSTQMVAELNLPEDQGAEMVPMILDHGIVISEPAEYSEVRRGTTIRVTYTISGSASVGGSYINFSLHHPVNPGMLDYNTVPVTTISHRHALQDTNQDVPHSFYWSLPEDIPVGDNYIIVARLNDDIWGESGRFDIRHLFDPVEANFAGQENGIRINHPEGGETFRPGGTMLFRWFSTIHEDLGNLDIQLLKNCEHLYSENPTVVSGNPNTPDSDSVLRIPEGISEEGLYCLYVHDLDVSRAQSYSRTFEILSPAGSFGEGASSGSTETDPQLQVITPGTGGEHWRVGSVEPIKWRFYPGLEATVPGSWTITLYKYDPSSGYSVVHTFTANSFDIRQVNQGGLNWYEYTYNWQVESWDLEQNYSGEYKIGVSSMGYQDLGSLNFTIGDFSQQGYGWNLRIQDLKVENMELIAMVENLSRPDEGGVSGRLDFDVEVDGAIRQVTVSAPPQTLRSHGVPVVLGHLNNLIDDLSRYECAIPVTVTVDSTNRVNETNEDDNELSKEIYRSTGTFSINLRMPYGDVTYNGVPAQCSVDADDNQLIAMLEFKNCGTIFRSGNVRVTQSGWWSSSEPGTLAGATPAIWHDEETILNSYVSVGPRDLPEMFTLGGDGTYMTVQLNKHHLRRNYLGQIVDSSIHIYFDGDFTSHVTHNPWNILLDVIE